MRRINNNRMNANTREHSCQQTLKSGLFRQSSCRRGHSLMRRTELSWEKLQQVGSQRKQEPPHGKQSKQNDYLIRQRPVNKKTQNFADKQKTLGSQYIKTKFCQRTNLFPRPKSNKKIQSQCNLLSPAKPIHQISPCPLTKPFLSQKQIRDPPTRKRKRKYHFPQQTIKEEESKQLYQMEFIMETNRKKSVSRQKLKSQASNIEIPSQSYQLYPQPSLISSKKIKDQPSEQVSQQVNQDPFQIANKSKQQESTMSTLRNSGLPLFSRKCSILSNIQSPSNKVTLHLEIIAQLAEYSKQLLEMYEDSSDWEELAFLTYKKYYLERIKVARALRGIGANPFQLNVCSITAQELQSFRKKMDGIKLAKQVEAENRKFVDSLRSFYNLIIEKSGNYINMEERDDFTGEVLKQMKLEIDLLKQIEGEEAKKRMGRVYRCAFLISELSGHRIISYEQSLDMDSSAYIRKASCLFHQCLIL